MGHNRTKLNDLDCMLARCSTQLQRSRWRAQMNSLCSLFHLIKNQTEKRNKHILLNVNQIECELWQECNGYSFSMNREQNQWHVFIDNANEEAFSESTEQNECDKLK